MQSNAEIESKKRSANTCDTDKIHEFVKAITSDGKPGVSKKPKLSEPASLNKCVSKSSSCNTFACDFDRDTELKKYKEEAEHWKCIALEAKKDLEAKEVLNKDDVIISRLDALTSQVSNLTSDISSLKFRLTSIDSTLSLSKCDSKHAVVGHWLDECPLPCEITPIHLSYDI